MSIQVVVDMNLSPEWVDWFKRHKWQAVHWTAVGDPVATDRVIMEWARTNGYVVFTHDLDFGALLAITNANGPSVIQVRAQDVFPEHLGPLLLAALRQHESLLEQGALIVVNENTLRVRILPLREK